MDKLTKIVVIAALLMESAFATFGQITTPLDDRKDNIMIYLYDMDLLGSLPFSASYTVNFVNYTCPEVMNCTPSDDFQITESDPSSRVFGNYVPDNGICWYSDWAQVTITIHVGSMTYTVIKIAGEYPEAHFYASDFLGSVPIDPGTSVLTPGDPPITP